MLGTPDQPLHALLGELADFDAADRAAILATLSPEERDRVRRLLDDGNLPPERVAEPADLTGPIMGAAAGLHRHDTRRQRGEELQQFRAMNLLAKNDAAVGVRRVRLKNSLGDIQADYANFLHGRLPQVVR